MMFKKLITANIFILIFAVNVYSAFNAELSVILSGGSDAKTMIGTGGDISLSINNLTAFMYKGFYTIRKDERNISGTKIDLDYSHMAQMGGIEFYIPVRLLINNRIKWKNSICAGYSWTRVTAEYSGGDSEVSDSGNIYLASTGLEYIMYQHFSPFIDLSYYTLMYNNSLSRSENSGWQINAGMRYSLGGSMSIRGDY